MNNPKKHIRHTVGYRIPIRSFAVPYECASSPYYVLRDAVDVPMPTNTQELEEYIKEATRVFSDSVASLTERATRLNSNDEAQLRFITESVIQALRVMREIRK